MVSIEQFKQLALSFAQAEEKPHFEKHSFRVQNKIFATVNVKAQQAVVKLSDVEQSVFAAYDPDIIYPVKGAWGKQGWTQIELKKIKKTILKDVLTSSYQNVRKKQAQRRFCENGHEFYKSSACPVCPICEKNKKPLAGFLSQLSAPARRALQNAGIKTISQLRKKSEAELLSLHGMGPASIPKLRAILATPTAKTTTKTVLKENENGLNTNEVSAFIEKLNSHHQQIMLAVREIILNTDHRISEHIKWNSPAFFYNGEMEPFNAKEYKRDFMVTNFRQKDYVLLIFPTGSKLDGISPLLEGDYADGRRMIKIYDLKELKLITRELQKIVKKWITLLDK